MNGAILIVLGAVYFLAAYFLYGRLLTRLFGIDPERKTPAHTETDGVDYVPARPTVLFGHHFASIAGAGPIVGPVLAAYFGWLPALLWILIGCVFVGAFHDFAALFLSVRNRGRSIGHVIETLIGYSGRQIFLLFAWAALVLVVAIFGILVAKTFVSTPAVATASLLFIVIAPVFGYLVYRRGVAILPASVIFVPALFLCVWFGTLLPLDLQALFGFSPTASFRVWLCVLFAYVFVASVIPVWILLQPRDYLNSYLLYAMIALGFLGILVAMPELRMPAFAGFKAVSPAGTQDALFPLLFVTVACGACSGFHALVSSGTTAKQLSAEKHILPVGYGGMLVEGLLAIMALVSVAYLSANDYATMMKGGPVAAFSSGLAAFGTKLGVGETLGKTFVSLAISAFMLTTLDTATRLTRFTWQELFLPRTGGQPANPTAVAAVLANPYSATLIAIGAAAGLAFSGGGLAIWPVFGASNQLLAALTLLAITLYLIRKGKPCLYALLPMLFMLIVSGFALAILCANNFHALLNSADDRGQHIALLAAGVFLLAMAAVLSVQAVLAIVRARTVDATP